MRKRKRQLGKEENKMCLREGGRVGGRDRGRN